MPTRIEAVFNDLQRDGLAVVAQHGHGPLLPGGQV